LDVRLPVPLLRPWEETVAFDFIAWHDRDTTNHKVETDKAAAAGYRTSSLSVYGDRAAPRYAAVMVKRAAIHAEAQHFGLSAAQFQQVFNEMSAKGFGPYLLSATGPANNPLIAASFRPMSPTPLTRTGVATARRRATRSWPSSTWKHGGMA